MDLAVDQATQNAGPGLVSSLIDYVALRTAIRMKPDVIRARLKACGACKDRALLERELAVADGDLKSLQSVETATARVLGMDPWTAGKLGVRVRPDGVTRQPPACIVLYDRAFDCKLAQDDRSAGELGKACYVEDKLHRLCAAGQAKPFYDYVDFLRRKARGDLLFETGDNKVFREEYYYNVRADMAFPRPGATVDDQPYYTAVTDNRQVGALASAKVSGMALTGPPIRFAQAAEFLPPWRQIVHEDNVAVSKTARLIDCQYRLAQADRVDAFLFWYRERPARAEPDHLSSRMPGHPLLRVGPPVTACPISAQAALALNPRVSSTALQEAYSGKLK